MQEDRQTPHMMHREGIEMATTATPIISIRLGDDWVPVNTLDAEQQTSIRHRVAEVLAQAIERQIALLADQPATDKRT